MQLVVSLVSHYPSPESTGLAMGGQLKDQVLRLNPKQKPKPGGPSLNIGPVSLKNNTLTLRACHWNICRIKKSVS